ncbi:MAG: hypothetical protein QOE65_2502 [Solirubrobacteraceae bacterium]|jgi:hypothetical protein|nr:hypothetical protein [Solirubrobacteraceae bacterium]
MLSRRAWVVVTGLLVAGGAFAVGLVLWPGGEEEAPRSATSRPTIVQDDAQVLHRSTAEVRRTVRVLRGLGVDWLRVTANWSFIAPAPLSAARPRFDASDPGAYPPGAWDRLDRAVHEARDAGLEVSIDIGFWAPRWAVARPSPEPDRQRDGIDPAAFADFSAAVARRYGDRAAAYTIWNEPNYQVFLRPQWRRTGQFAGEAGARRRLGGGRPSGGGSGGWEVASADAYRAMVYAAVPRIRAAAPRAVVLIGGTAALGTSAPSARTDQVPPLRFLRELACVDAALRPLRDGDCARFSPLPGDGWAHHPYAPRRPPDAGDPDPDTAVLADQGRLADLLDRLHAAGRTRSRLGLWVTEFGYETSPPDPTQPVSLAEQARWLPEAEAIALADPRVRSFAQFLFRDLPERPGVTERERWGDFQSGLELPDGTDKPAMRAFAYPLTASRAGPGRVRFWGRARPGTGRRLVRITADGRPVRQETTTEDGVFGFIAAADPRATYRLQIRRDGAWTPVGVPLPGAHGPTVTS